MKGYCILLIAAMSFNVNIASAQTYTYDELGRVKTVTQAGKTTTYTYDETDNRTSITTTGGTPNNPPACTNKTINLPIPNSYPYTTTLTAATFLVNCSDADGDTLTLTSPAVPYTLTISAGQTKSIPFKATDNKSPEVSATLTFTRP